MIKKKQAKKKSGEQVFVEALKKCQKKFGGREAVFINVVVDKNGVNLVSVVDIEGDIIYDGETNIRKDKPTYLG